MGARDFNRSVGALLLVFILARVPVNDNINDVVKALREAAVLAGCAEPRIAMRYPTDPDRSITIEVTCKGD